MSLSWIPQATELRGMPGRILRSLRYATRVRRRFAKECLLGILVVGLLTMCGLGLRWNLSTASLMYLLCVVLLALRYGFWQASVVSLAAVLVQSYCFAPPAFSLYIADVQNGVAILVFEITALLVSRLSTREKIHANEVDTQRRSLEQMFAISRGALLLNLQESPVEQMAELILKECGLEAVAILDADQRELKIAGNWPWNPEPMAHRVSAGEGCDGVEALSYRTLIFADAPTGSLLTLSGSGTLYPLTMDALASLVALTFERYRALRNERSSDAAKQTEQLRTAVLDGLAHAFKTPLTIIRAASSGLLELGDLNYPQQELTMLIDAQSMLLDELATRLLQTARMDGEAIVLDREMVSIRTLVCDVAASVSKSWGERNEGWSDSPRIQVKIEGGSLSAMADYELMTATVKELLENAAKYSIAGSQIVLCASETSSEIMVSVHNRGPVIRLEDRERIFERFYRCPDHRYSAPGTGIGLSVARHAVEAHGGHIWVISGEHEGTTFNFSLPNKAGQRIDALRDNGCSNGGTNNGETRDAGRDQVA